MKFQKVSTEISAGKTGRLSPLDAEISARGFTETTVLAHGVQGVPLRGPCNTPETEMKSGHSRALSFGFVRRWRMALKLARQLEAFE